MFYLPQNYQNTENLLVFHTVNEAGILTDAVQIGWRILDPDGTQVFPAAGYEDATNKGRLSEGRYYAYDESVSDAAWTVPAAATLGIWCIEWQFQVTTSDPVRTFSEPFEVAQASISSTKGYLGTPYRTYVAPCELRKEGLITPNDPRLEMLIQEAQGLVEQQTRNMFRAIYRTVQVDGPEADRLFLTAAIIGIEELSVRDGSTLSNEALAVAFERSDASHRYEPHPDHRRNPTIGLRMSLPPGTAIFASRGRSGVFGAGYVNYRIKGVFGFVESDGSVPPLIQYAMKRLIILSQTVLADPSQTTGGVMGPIDSVRAGGYEIDYASTAGSNSSAAFTLQEALNKSRDVEEALRKFQAPRAISSPRTLLGRVTL